MVRPMFTGTIALPTILYKENVGAGKPKHHTINNLVRFQSPHPKTRIYLFYSPLTRRRKLRIACDDFFSKSHPALTPLLLLSAKGHARRACSVASALATARCRYQPFAGCVGSVSTSKTPKTSFSCGSDTSEQSPLCSGLFFCLWQKNKPSARSLAPPFPTKSAALRGPRHPLRLRLKLLPTAKVPPCGLLLPFYAGSTPAAEKYKISFL